MKTSGNAILITGGTSGIGLAFAEEFHRSGNKVIICGRRQDRLAEITKRLPGMISRACDISVRGERESLSEWAVKNHPDINVLINNAGVQYAFNLQQGMDPDKLEAEINTNLTAPIHLASLFIKHLTSRSDAAIINISSGLAFVPIAFMPVYCATKAGIHSFSLSLRFQLKDTPVKVFEIAPPAVDTELGHDRREDKTQTHGGLSIGEFMAEAMEAIRNDTLEAAVGMAKGLREKNEALFANLNQRF